MCLASAVCTALAAVCKLIGPDLINAVLPAVTGLASHPKDLVRKKAVMALHRFQQLDQKHEGQLAGSDLDSYYRQALCDKVCEPLNSLPGLRACISDMRLHLDSCTFVCVALAAVCCSS